MVLTRQAEPSLLPDGIWDFCHELAEGAREIALTYFRQPVSYERKDDLSPVTIADQSIERFLRDRIQQRFSSHGIVGEEQDDKPGTRFTWYIDPIDGTKSFISGMPLFGTLIALYDEELKKPVLGMIDMPALGERWIGDGTTCYLNGEIVRVSGCEQLSDAQTYTSSPDIFDKAEWAVYDRLSQRSAFRRYGGDCYLYSLLAGGYCDLVVEASLKTFDFMALIPVVEGAGGFITDWNGKALTPKSDGRVVAAATKALLESVILETATQGAVQS